LPWQNTRALRRLDLLPQLLDARALPLEFACRRQLIRQHEQHKRDNLYLKQMMFKTFNVHFTETQNILWEG
jgi:hypothetical protein